ncbi:hypothetical protein [Stenotrophomonas pictorum]|uniref:hypothetical protein n=1 Tax=Stenotrophomonas pictorum TaxID=86184 RepID=UPI001F51FF2F|nr:hypothetical protein [Stenotrophomonas pictorum]
MALLMRMPEDRRWMLVARLLPLVVRLRCAFSDITLVLITCAMVAIPFWRLIRHSWTAGVVQCGKAGGHFRCCNQ